jgi:hypothetical protein
MAKLVQKYSIQLLISGMSWRKSLLMFTYSMMQPSLKVGAFFDLTCIFIVLLRVLTHTASNIQRIIFK